MPKMGNTKCAISMTRSDTWTTTCLKVETGETEDFCINHCPHPAKPCKGDCPEMKEFRKTHRKK